MKPSKLEKQWGEDLEKRGVLKDLCGALIQATIMGDITCANERPCKTHVWRKEYDWRGEFDENFVRIALGGSENGKFMDAWFIKDGIAAKDIKQFIEDLLIKILAKAETMGTAREVRHLLKDYILKNHEEN